MKGTAVLFAMFALGCSEQGFHQLDKDPNGSGAAIEVDPSYIDFGEVGAGDDAVVKSFEVFSVGDADLEVSGIELSGSASGSFTVISTETSFVLPPGAAQVIEVAFSPLGAYDQVANALVVSNAEPEKVPVELLGAGSVPELSISPDPFDFGTTYIGCKKDNEIELTNVGSDLLVISGIDYAGDSMTMDANYTIPIVLEPGEFTTLAINFDPMDEGNFESEISVTSNEPMGVRTSAHTGEGKFAAEYEDNWEIPVDPPSDIIFSVDQSCSMGDDVSRLASNFSSFISQLSSYSNDWQIIVANKDNGCNNSGILTPSDSNYVSLFQNAIQSGGNGMYTEALLTIAKNAVEMTDSGECNTGFLRADAMLHVILVSDEPEQSSYFGGLSWDQNVDAMIAKKGSASNVRVSAIAGPVPGGCGSADPGTGYSEAVSYTGGVFLSICDNWADPSNLAMLAEASINQDTFELSHNPVEDTIVVYLNGTQRNESGWHYDSVDNAVVMDVNVPEEGDSVDIEYAGYATCD